MSVPLQLAIELLKRDKISRSRSKEKESATRWFLAEVAEASLIQKLEEMSKDVDVIPIITFKTAKATLFYTGADNLTYRALNEQSLTLIFQ